MAEWMPWPPGAPPLQASGLEGLLPDQLNSARSREERLQ